MVQRLPQLMDWLAEGVPLSLLIDLLDPIGPDSHRIIRDEPADTAWVPRLDVAWTSGAAPVIAYPG
jgi:hypothetical protein